MSILRSFISDLLIEKLPWTLRCHQNNLQMIIVSSTYKNKKKNQNQNQKNSATVCVTNGNCKIVGTRSILTARNYTIELGKSSLRCLLIKPYKTWQRQQTLCGGCENLEEGLMQNPSLRDHHWGRHFYINLNEFLIIRGSKLRACDKSAHKRKMWNKNKVCFIIIPIFMWESSNIRL